MLLDTENSNDVQIEKLKDFLKCMYPEHTKLINDREFDLSIYWEMHQVRCDAYTIIGLYKIWHMFENSKYEGNSPESQSQLKAFACNRDPELWERLHAMDKNTYNEFLCESGYNSTAKEYRAAHNKEFIWPKLNEAYEYELKGTDKMQAEELYKHVQGITKQYEQNIPYSDTQATSIVAKNHSKETGDVQYKIWQNLVGTD